MGKPRRRGGLARPDAAPPALGAIPSTVLYEQTPLIGRERELETIRAYLLGDSVRLVTLTGPGGIGKTRLALAAARYVEPAFPDGVWFVDLAQRNDAAGIDTAVAHTLGLGETAAFSPAQQVAAYVKDRHLLLVLDNFEHLLSAATRVTELLVAAPRLKVLVTSREPLKLRLEHRLAVTGLALPDLGATDPASIVQAPAVALFMEHARRIQPEWTLTTADARSIAALLHRLDGIPLAIRIAAAHSHVLTPTAMLTRLRGQVLLSTEEERDAPARHLTLRRAIEWSYGLLGAGEQAAFRHLGVFVGDWTLEAAEGVIPDAGAASPAWAILARLVDKSLVQSELFGSEDRRYRLLEPIREYALERLADSGEMDAARDGHARYYVTLAEEAAAAGWGPGEEAWFRRLDAEYENVRAAFRWMIEQRDGELSLRLTAALTDFDAWIVRGYLREGQRWLHEARSLGSAAPPVLRFKALFGEGVVTLLLGDYPQARTLLEEALALAESIGDPELVARARLRLGAVAARQGKPGEAQAIFEEILGLGTKGRYPHSITALALILRGNSFVLMGDLGRAAAAFAESMDLARSIGSARLRLITLVNLAQLTLQRGDTTGAAGAASEAIRLARTMRSRRGFTWAVIIAARVNAGRDDLERAARLLGAVDAQGEWGDIASPFYSDAAASAELRTRARQKLGETVYQTALAAGHAMSVGQVAELALASLDAAAPPGAHSTATGPDRSRPLLSDRERAVLRLISEGLPNKQIATALTISERTVKFHVASAMNKLGVDNRAHAAVTAIQRSLL
jgi:predicted ATPase/DNA-binding CsgD family transcriptional regulator